MNERRNASQVKVGNKEKENRYGDYYEGYEEIDEGIQVKKV